MTVLGRLLTILRVELIGRLATSLLIQAVPEYLGLCTNSSTLRLRVALRIGPLCCCVCVGAMASSTVWGDLVVVPVVVVADAFEAG